MPGRVRVPVSVRRCVNAVAKTNGGDVSSAFAICVAKGQKDGDIKPGTMTQTAKGKKHSQRKSREKDAAAKSGEYEKLLAGARTQESLRSLVAQGMALVEQDEEVPEGEEGAEEDPLAALDGTIWGDLKVTVTFPVGRVADDTRKAALKLLKQYKDNFQGGVGGTSRWTVTSMRVRYLPRDSVIEIEFWLDVKNYPGMRVLSDLVQQVSDAALELSTSMMPKDAKDMLGSVHPDVVEAEPLEFVQSM